MQVSFVFFQNHHIHLHHAKMTTAAIIVKVIRPKVTVQVQVTVHLFSKIARKLVVYVVIKRIASGLSGVNGLHALRLVERDRKKERGLHRVPNMEDRIVMAVTRKQKHVIKENVKVLHAS